MFGGGVHRRSKEKRDANFAQAGDELSRCKVDANAERFHHIGRSAFGADAAIAVLGDAHACARGYQGGCSRDIEGAAGIAAGAAGIEQVIFSLTHSWAGGWIAKGVAFGVADVESEFRSSV